MLNDKQYKAILLLLQGKPNKEIAKELNISVQTICAWKNNSEFKEEYKNTACNLFDDLLVEAIENVADIMRHGKTETARLNACKEILNRCGLKERKDIDNNNNTIIVSLE